ncbi:ribonuclease P protein component [Sphingobacterium deserti]|uniref:Ribonuclease P protein component n=2 Tax=Sphingobacterium deserti TaxID=1229276 RepID=A0A0B8T555_9SPHI|nr:ribonuclease P protein component [Sphingobacterium deserti]
MLKRRMRESYRLQKHTLYSFLQQHMLSLTVAFQYVGKEKTAYAQLHQRMELVLGKLKDECTKIYLGEDD